MTPVTGRPRRSSRALLAALTLTLALPISATGAQGHPNPALKVTVLAPGGQALALINSGQTFDGVTFEGIPDGLGVVPVGNGSRFIDIFVAFEQSHVPFQGFADFEDSSVQRARLDLRTRQIVSLDEVLPPSAGFVRFCSAFMAGPDEGFSDYTFFVNEESVDWLPVPAGAPYGTDPFSNSQAFPYRQAGYSVWLDANTGGFKPVAGMGRHNHENTVIVPGGWDDTVSLSGDDTFAAPSSQLYMYNAANPGALKQDRGTLFAFRVTHDNGVAVNAGDAFNGANDYLDIAPGDVFRGEFIEVDPDVARGLTADPPQAALENWSNIENVFQFIRVEDIAYDPDDPRTVYFADTGTSVAPNPATGRLMPGAMAQQGRIFKMVLNATDPTIVDSLTILADGALVNDPTSPASNKTMRRPDNLDVSASSIMVQEDQTGGAKVWQYTFATGTWKHVATANQSPAETSGIIDASEWLGDGWWVLDVQSHVNLPGATPAGVWGDDPEHEPIYPLGPALNSAYSLRREDGQLLLLFIPGS